MTFLSHAQVRERLRLPYVVHCDWESVRLANFVDFDAALDFARSLDRRPLRIVNEDLEDGDGQSWHDAGLTEDEAERVFEAGIA